MDGLMALVGSGEYLPAMAPVDRYLLAEAARGRAVDQVSVVCVPAAAGDEGEASIARWARQGVEHFTRLGASAQAARVVDRASADDPRWAALIEAADLIYFSGGDPTYLYQTLAGSRAWDAVQAARARGAVLAGCSAGAMILAQSVPDIRALAFTAQPGFGLTPAALILPHFDQLERYRPGVTALVRDRLTDGQFALGIDEETALVGRPGGAWTVMGLRGASVMTRAATRVYLAQTEINLPGPA